MLRSRIVFLLILVIAVIAVLLIRFVAPSLPTQPTATPPLPIQLEVAVNTLAYGWVNDQAQSFNAQRIQVDGRLVEVKVTQQDGVAVWQAGGTWTVARHPVLWIPEARFAIDYANDAGLRFDALEPSLASTSLIWGIFADRGDVLNKIQSPLDWATVQQAAAKESWAALGGQESWGFVKPAFARPKQSTAGFGVLLAAAAAYGNSGQLTDDKVANREFQRWLEPYVDAVPNFAALGIQPAAVFASRGVSSADFGLLPESEWIVYTDRIAARQAFRLVYPAYRLVFDLPIAIWSGPETQSAERTAARRFADYLLQESVQRQAVNYGLRPVKGSFASIAEGKFPAAISAGLLTESPPGVVIVPPSRSAAVSVLTWFEGYRRAP